MSEQKRYWFPAKRYGWGWGAPTAWQGWVVLLAYLALMVAAGLYWQGRGAAPAHLACVALLTAVLIAICWRTGEPPRWRWGDKRD